MEGILGSNQESVNRVTMDSIPALKSNVKREELVSLIQFLMKGTEQVTEKKYLEDGAFDADVHLEGRDNFVRNVSSSFFPLFFLELSSFSHFFFFLLRFFSFLPELPSFYFFGFLKHFPQKISRTRIFYP